MVVELSVRRVACHRAVFDANMVASHCFGGIVDRTGRVKSVARGDAP